MFRLHGHTPQRGQALVELALVLPILLILVLGVIEFGAAYQARITIVNAAREGARLAGRGNIFTDAQLMQVMQGQSRGVDILANGTVLVTTVESESGGFITYNTRTLCGSAATRLSSADLQSIHQARSGLDPAYLTHDDFVVVEIIYGHHALTGEFGDPLVMYTYAVMPISAPS